MMKSNAIFNSGANGLAFFISTISSILVRTYFINTLGVEILGLDSLFASIFLVLAFAELGLGSAVTFALYKPLENRDFGTAKSILNLLASFYRYVIVAILILGVLSSFLIQFITDVDLKIEHYQYFVVYIVAGSTTFLFAEYKALALASHLNYIESIGRLIFLIIKSGLQLIAIIFYESYLLFLFSTVLANIGMALLLRYIMLSKIPEIALIKPRDLDLDLKQRIFRNLKGGIYHRLGSVVVTGTDNILISIFSGAVSLGLYSSYSMIFSQLVGFLSQLIYPLSSTIGQAKASGKPGLILKYFEFIFCVYSFFVTVTTVGFYFCLNDLISIWLGNEYVLPNNIATFLSINMFIILMRKPSIICIDSLGLTWQIRHKSLVEACLNLVISLYLLVVFNMGVEGVILGTICSNILTNLWWEPYVLYKYSFLIGLKHYFFMYGRVVINNAIIISIGIFLFDYFPIVTDLYTFLQKCLSIIFYVSVVYIALNLNFYSSRNFFSLIKSRSSSV